MQCNAMQWCKAEEGTPNMSTLHFAPLTVIVFLLQLILIIVQAVVCSAVGEM